MSDRNHRPTATQQRLGRGLAALIGEIDALPAEREEARTEPVRPDARVPIAAVRPNPSNPRRSFDEDDLADLAASMRSHGLIQPILVRSVPDGTGYEIVAGERRWRAAQRAGLDEVPVIVREVGDVEALELAIIENVQRADLNPIEEAQGYRQLIERHDYSQVDLSRVIGKSRSHVANTMRLLKLPESVREMVSGGAITSGHARALVMSEDPLPLARRIVDDGLTVRAIEKLVADKANGEIAKRVQQPAPAPHPDHEALERRLSDALGLKVTLKPRKGGRGTLAIEYLTLDQLDELCTRLLNETGG